MKKLTPILTIAALSVLAAASSNAANVNYELSTNGNWNLGSNWTNNGVNPPYLPNSVPFDPNGGTDRVDVRIDTGDIVTINSAVPTVDRIVTLADGIVNIQTGAALTLNIGLLQRDAGTVNHSGGALVVSGTTLLGTELNAPGASYNLSGSASLTTNGIDVGNKSGSGATFSIDGNAVSITNSGGYNIRNGGTQAFVFNSAGISTINATTMNLTTAENITLSINLTSLVIAADTSFTLINGGSGLTLGEIFTNTNFIGIAANPTVQSASIFYDTVNNDVRLDVVAVPEPATTALVLGAAGVFAVLARRRRRA